MTRFSGAIPKCTFVHKIPKKANSQKAKLKKISQKGFLTNESIKNSINYIFSIHE